MSLSTEFIMSLGIQLVSVGIVIGIYKTTISFMQEQIKDLKIEMAKYNNVLTRLALVENSVTSAHKRIDEIKEEEND